MNVRQIYADMRPGGMTSRLALHQNESGIPLEISVYDGGASSDMSDWDECTLLITRPSGETGETPCTIKGDSVECTVTPELTKEVGQTIAELHFIGKDGQAIYSEPITVTITGAAHAKAEDESRETNSRYAVLDRAIGLAQDAETGFRNAITFYDEAVKAYMDATESLEREIEVNSNELTARLTKQMEETVAKVEKSITRSEQECRQATKDTTNRLTKQVSDTISNVEKTVRDLKAESAENIKQALDTLTKRVSDTESKVDKTIKKTESDYKSSQETIKSDVEKTVNGLKAESAETIKQALDMLTKQANETTNKWNGILHESITAYKEVENMMNEAMDRMQGQLDQAMEASKRAERAYNEAVKVLEETTAKQFAVSPLSALDAARQAQTSANEALERLEVIEAIEEAWLKKGGMVK